LLKSELGLGRVVGRLVGGSGARPVPPTLVPIPVDRDAAGRDDGINAGSEAGLPGFPPAGAVPVVEGGVPGLVGVFGVAGTGLAFLSSLHPPAIVVAASAVSRIARFIMIHSYDVGLA